MNEDGSERMRGWLPIPLTTEGMENSRETAQMLGGTPEVAGIHSSDLVRAVQSAHEIGQALQMPISPTPALRDWNIGHYTGESVIQHLDTMHSFIDNPHLAIPDGESYNDFLGRVFPFLDSLVKDPGNHIVVTHNRVMTLIRALASHGGQAINTELLKRKSPVEPSGALVVRPDWTIAHAFRPDDIDQDEISG